MVIIFNSHGVPEWSVTSSSLREHIDRLWAYLRTDINFASMDLGAGKELVFRCYGCHRWCPVQTASIDHYFPKSLLHFDIARSSTNTPFYKMGSTYYLVQPSGNFDGVSLDGSNITRQIKYTLAGNDVVYDYPEQVHHRVRIQNFLENDLSNLQPMCASCNSHKSTGIISPYQFRPTAVDAHQIYLLH